MAGRRTGSVALAATLALSSWGCAAPVQREPVIPNTVVIYKQGLPCRTLAEADNSRCNHSEIRPDDLCVPDGTNVTFQFRGPQRDFFVIPKNPDENPLFEPGKASRCNPRSEQGRRVCSVKQVQKAGDFYEYAIAVDGCNPLDPRIYVN